MIQLAAPRRAQLVHARAHDIEHELLHRSHARRQRLRDLDHVDRLCVQRGRDGRVEARAQVELAHEERAHDLFDRRESGGERLVRPVVKMQARNGRENRRRDGVLIAKESLMIKSKQIRMCGENGDDLKYSLLMIARHPVPAARPRAP